MPSIQTLVAFSGVAFLLALSPGQDNLFVLVQAVHRGWRVGLCVVLGLCVGVVGHTVAVALGLAAVVATSPKLFAAIRLCGAGYMAYLAWRAWHAPIGVGETMRTQSVREQLAWGTALRWVGRGVVMNLTNPKVLIFFLAFLPQFADPARGNVAIQVLVFGCVFITVSLPVFVSIACCSGKLGELMQSSGHAQRWLNRSAATVFGALALRLAFMQR